MDETPIRQSMGRWVEKLRAENPDHPSAETLIEYHLGEIAPGDHFEVIFDQGFGRGVKP